MKFGNSIDTNVIPNLDQTNCAILNNYTTEQISLLLNAIIQRAEIVLNEKIQLLGLANQTTPTTNTTMEQQITNTTTNNQVTDNTTVNGGTTVDNETGSIQREHEM